MLMRIFTQSEPLTGAELDHLAIVARAAGR